MDPHILQFVDGMVVNTISSQQKGLGVEVCASPGPFCTKFVPWGPLVSPTIKKRVISHAIAIEQDTRLRPGVGPWVLYCACNLL